MMGLLGSRGVLTLHSTPMDSILCWNVRGLNEDARQFKVKSLLRNYKVSIAGLLETKVRSCNFSKLLRNFDGLDYIDNYDNSLNGRLLVFWNKSIVSVNCLFRSNQLVHCYVTFTAQQFSCYVSFVYAENEPVDRIPLWLDLGRVGQNMVEPWLILGDFNTTLHQDERVRDGEGVLGDVSELETFTGQFELLDLRYNGIKLTWCNKRQA